MKRSLIVAAAICTTAALAGCQRSEIAPTAPPTSDDVTVIPATFTPPNDDDVTYDPFSEAISYAYGWAVDNAGASGVGFEIVSADKATDRCEPNPAPVSVCRQWSATDPGVVVWNRTAMNELAEDEASGGAAVLAYAASVFARDGVCRAGEFVRAVMEGYTRMYTLTEEQGRAAASAFTDPEQRDGYTRGFTEGCA